MEKPDKENWISERCPHCDGTGSFYEKTCSVCEGLGMWDVFKDDNYHAVRSLIDSNVPIDEKIAKLRNNRLASVTPERYLVSLTKFNDNVEVMYKDKPLSEVSPLTKETYSPGGWTALYDAIGATIDTAKRGETDTIVTIMTDGAENRSKKWKKAGVKALIDIRQNENKWGFVYFGSDQSTWAEAQSLGVYASNYVSYAPTSTGNAIHAMSVVRSCYTSGALNNTYDVSNLTSNIQKEDLLK